MRFQIDFVTRNNLVILEPTTMFDAVMAGALFRRSIAEGHSFQEAKRRATEYLPFNKSKTIKGRQVNLTSIPEFTPEALYIATYVKKFETMRYMETLPEELIKELLQNIPRWEGPYGMTNHNCYAVLTAKISYVVDIDEKKLLEDFGHECTQDGVRSCIEENVFFLGAESRLGYGVIDKVSVSKTDRKIKRYVPFDENNHELKYEDPTIILRTEPPYWAKEKTILCALAEL